MEEGADVLIDFVNWWDGWALYGELGAESQAMVDKFLADHYPHRASKISPKSTEELP